MGRTTARGLRAAAFAGAAALAGCGPKPGGPPPPPNGTLTVDFAPSHGAVTNLTLSSASVHLEGITVIGDVTPDGRSMISDLSIDALGSGVAQTLSAIPQGVYSRVRFKLEHAAAQGTWRGMPFSYSVENDDGSRVAPVDLSSRSGVDVAPGHDGTFTVTLDVASWFANAILDGATAAGGQITIGGSNNSAVAQQITARVAGSFALHDSTVQ